MHLLTILLFVISSNLDNLIVAAALGIKKLKINFTDNLIFASISFFGTLISMFLGKIACRFLPVRFSVYIGSIILILIGLWTIFDTIKSEILKKQEFSDLGIPSYNNFVSCPEKADIDRSGHIDSKEAIFIGISLAANNTGMGLGIGATGVSIIITSIMTFLFSIITISLGLLIGRKCSSKLSGLWSGIITALIIIFIGIYELLI